MKYFSTLACSAAVEKLNRQTLICALAAQWPVAPARDGVWFCLRRLPPRPRRSSLDLVWFPDWESGHDWITGGHLHDYVCGTSREFNSAFSILAADDGQFAQSAEKTGGHPDTRGSILALLGCILLLALSLFSWNYREFFGPDAVYYFARKLNAWSDILRAFTTIDDRGHYRPMGLLLFSTVFYPLSRQSLAISHLIPLAFHAVNIALLFVAARRLTGSRVAALGAAGFFGLHRVNFFVTFGITFIPDFTGVFFLLAALVCYLKGDDDSRWRVFAFGLWICSLLSKETAIVFPAILTVYELSRRRSHYWSAVMAFALKRAAPYWIVAFAFVCFLVSMRGGELYPADLQDPYRASLASDSLLPKIKYFWWGLNLPQGTGIGGLLGTTLGIEPTPIVLDFPFHTSASAALLLPFALGFVLFAARAVMQGNRLMAFSLCCFLFGLAPVMPLAGKVMQHNLYFPLFGLALAFGLYTRELVSGKFRPAAVLLAVVFLFSTSVGVVNQRRSSWPVHASRLSALYLAQFKSAASETRCPSSVLVTKTSAPEVAWHTDGGNLFKVFGPCPEMDVYFEELSQEPTDGSALRLELRNGL